ncbi:MAG: methylmalonyl-CoA epimerase [Proteobacteria bacterium]|nr:methylmalonyl-CoA epimerase [Pseudomonadota bacterium]
MIGNLNHVAIAVPDLDAAINQYQSTFGAFVTTPQDLPNHGIRVAIVNLPNTKIELITPLGEASPIQNFLQKNPQGGIHHLCYEVPDIAAARDKLAAAGMEVIGDGMPTLGYHNNPVLFFNPKDCLGALIELEEVASLKSQSRVEIELLATHKEPPSSHNTLEGTRGVGIRVEVDYKRSTPQDNKEDN